MIQMKDSEIIISGEKINERDLFSLDKKISQKVDKLLKKQEKLYKKWLDKYKAFKCKVNEDQTLIFSKSSKENSKYQLTTFIKNKPFSDTIRNSKGEILEVLKDYYNLELIKGISNNGRVDIMEYFYDSLYDYVKDGDFTYFEDNKIGYIKCDIKEVDIIDQPDVIFITGDYIEHNENEYVSVNMGEESKSYLNTKALNETVWFGYEYGHVTTGPFKNKSAAENWLKKMNNKDKIKNIDIEINKVKKEVNRLDNLNDKENIKNIKTDVDNIIKDMNEHIKILETKKSKIEKDIKKNKIVSKNNIGLER